MKLNTKFTRFAVLLVGLSMIVTAFLLPRQAHAATNDWETTDSVMLGAALGTLAYDWAQTRYIAANPARYHETNPILGKHPSMGKVNTYFALCMVSTVGISIALPQDYRRLALGGLILVETAVIFNNRGLGIKAKF